MIKTPCPHCDERDGAMCNKVSEPFPWIKLYFVQCLSCGATGPVCDSAEQAEREWEKR